MTAVTPAYWDIDADSGAGGTGSIAPAGTWDASAAKWNPNADGTGATNAWTVGQKAVFAAGTDATDPYIVTVDGQQDIAGLSFEEGTVTLANGTSGALRMVAPTGVAVATGLTAMVAVPITEDANSREVYKTGDGTLVLSGANAYTGGTNVLAGTLQLGASGVIPNTSAVRVSGATAVLNLADNNQTIASLNMGNGGTVTTGTGTLTLAGDAQYDGTGAGATISGKLDLGAATRTVTVGNSSAANDLTISADISGTGVGLTKAGAGKLLLSGTNTYTGPTTLAAGTLEVTSVTALPGYASAGNVVFDGGTLLYINGGSLTTGDVDTILANATKNSGALAIDTTSGDLTQWAALNMGGVGLTKLGANKLTLDQANTYTGATTVSAGTLQLSNADAIAASSGLTLAGGTLVHDTGINLKNLTITVNNTVISGTETLNFSEGGTITNTAYPVTIRSAITGSPVVNANQTSNNDLTFAPTVGTVTLGAISGPNGCDVILGGTTTGNTIASSSNAKINLDCSGTWTILGDAIAYEHWLRNGTLIVEGLIKCNNRTLNLNGGVTLVINGSMETAHASYPFSWAADGGTLKGTGVMKDDLISVPAAGTIAPGFPTGTLTISKANCTIAGTLAITVDGDSYSTLAVGGTLDISAATAILDITEINPGNGDMVIATYTTLVGSEFATVKGLPSGWAIDYFYNEGTAIALTGGTLLGDTDNNGVVDAADFMTLKQNFGRADATLGAQEGDFTSPADNDVDWTDLSILMSNVSAGSTAPVMTPEPATLGLLAFGALAMLRRRRAA